MKHSTLLNCIFLVIIISFTGCALQDVQTSSQAIQTDAEMQRLVTEYPTVRDAIASKSSTFSEDELVILEIADFRIQSFIKEFDAFHTKQIASTDVSLDSLASKYSLMALSYADAQVIAKKKLLGKDSPLAISVKYFITDFDIRAMAVDEKVSALLSEGKKYEAMQLAIGYARTAKIILQSGIIIAGML